MRQVLGHLADRAQARRRLDPRAGLAYRPLVASTLPPLGNGEAGPASVDTLVQRAIHRIILAALATRALVLPVILVALLAHARSITSSPSRPPPCSWEWRWLPPSTSACWST